MPRAPTTSAPSTPSPRPGRHTAASSTSSVVTEVGERVFHLVGSAERRCARGHLHERQPKRHCDAQTRCDPKDYGRSVRRAARSTTTPRRYQRPGDAPRLKTTPHRTKALCVRGMHRTRSADGENCMSNDMDEIVQEFLVESYESLDRLDGDLLALERDPHSKDTLASIFRVMHTIKGTCGFLGFSRLERVAHAAESLLGGLRDGSLEVNPPIASALLATGDALRQMLSNIERAGNDGEEDFLHLVATLERLRASGGVSANQRIPVTPPTPRKAADAPARPAPSARPRARARTRGRARLGRRRQHPRGRRHPGQPDDARRRARAHPQPHQRAHRRHRARPRPGRGRPASQLDHRRPAGRRDAHPSATDQHRLGPLPPRGPRPRHGARQAGARRDRGRRHRARPLDHRGDQGPADAPRPQRRRPRDRAARRSRGRRASPSRASCTCARRTRAARSRS